MRFSDAEWAGIDNAARARGMHAAELVRHAAVGFAAGELASGSGALPADFAAQIERIYRGVYLLSTLKRDEMIREGRHDELERVAAMPAHRWLRSARKLPNCPPDRSKTLSGEAMCFPGVVGGEDF
ncbi:MAG: hypothetical protein F4Z95_04525 [Gammaproteobacteria bacterium]|nr:hypothetical protein [Gammaproteobacteria bacterium]